MTDPRRLPDGRTVSPLSWGCWRLTTDDVAVARGRLDAALEAESYVLDPHLMQRGDARAAIGDSEHRLRGELATARSLARQLGRMARSGGDPVQRLWSRHSVGLADLYGGRFRRGLRAFDECLALASAMESVGVWSTT